MKKPYLLFFVLVLVFISSCCYHDVAVTFTNTSDESIISIQYKNHNATFWESNILDFELTKSDSFLCYIEKANYDFKYIFSDLVTIIDENVDLQQIEIATVLVSRGST